MFNFKFLQTAYSYWLWDFLMQDDWICRLVYLLLHYYLSAIEQWHSLYNNTQPLQRHTIAHSLTINKITQPS